MNLLIQLKKLSIITSVPSSKTEKPVQYFVRENLKEETTGKTAEVGGIACEENGVIMWTRTISLSDGCNKHIVVQLMNIIAVWLIDIASFLFYRIVLCTVCKLQAYFIMLNPRRSVTHIVCLQFYFLVSRPGMGRI